MHFKVIFLSFSSYTVSYTVFCHFLSCTVSLFLIFSLFWSNFTSCPQFTVLVIFSCFLLYSFFSFPVVAIFLLLPFFLIQFSILVCNFLSVINFCFFLVMHFYRSFVAFSLLSPWLPFLLSISSSSSIFHAYLLPDLQSP